MILSTLRVPQRGLLVMGIVALLSVPHQLFLSMTAFQHFVYEVTEPDTLDEGPLPGLIHDAGLENSSMVEKLPHWKDIKEMYGSDEAVILVGANTCKTFRETVPQKDRWLAVAGMYNTGTNLLAKYLMENCRIPDTKGKFEGILWQVRLTCHSLLSI